MRALLRIRLSLKNAWNGHGRAGAMTGVAVRGGWFVAAVIVALVAVVRGNSDLVSSGDLIVPAMCLAAAVTAVIAGMSYALGSGRDDFADFGA